MLNEEFEKLSSAAKSKADLLASHPLGYVVLSILAGIYIGIGTIVSLSVGGQLSGQPYAKIIMGLSFSVALSLVVTGRAELFTGNNMIMAAGVKKGKVSAPQMIGLWVVCWLGNLAGSVIIGVLYCATGLCKDNVLEVAQGAAVAKVTATGLELLVRGILCNVLVCMAVWCWMKMESEAGKLIMLMLCIFTFYASGFEHSVANMSIFAVALVEKALDYPHPLLVCGGNLIMVTIGNVIGGAVMVAMPYMIAITKRPCPHKTYRRR